MPFTVKRIVQRRKFLKMSLGAAAMALHSPVQKALLASSQQAHSWKQQFDAAMQEKPWLMAFKGTQQTQFSSTNPVVTGKIPSELHGTLFRNGPARLEVNDYRYQHWFDGDGMIQAFQINDKGVSHKARIIQTSKYQEEVKAGRALYSGFASTPPNPKGATSPDSVNVANISVLPHHNKLFALWEAGSAYEIDPLTLETRGIHNWSEDSAALPFSAHPRVEPDGTIWNFGYAPDQDALLIWHIDKHGKLQNIKLLRVKNMSIPHDFLVTAKHIIVMLPPFYYENTDANTFVDAFNWHGKDVTRVLVIDKNTLSLQHTYELPAQWVFHFGNAWEDASGTIRFDAARTKNVDVMIKEFRNIMRGHPSSDITMAQHYQYTIDVKHKRITETPLMAANRASEFPSIDPRVSTQKYTKVFVLSADKSEHTEHGQLNAVSMLNVDSGQEDRYVYEKSQLPEEHLFVAKPGSKVESEGWVLGTFLDYATKNTGLNIFDANNLAAGPRASIILPYALPMGLHGKFLHS